MDNSDVAVFQGTWCVKAAFEEGWNILQGYTIESETG